MLMFMKHTKLNYLIQRYSSFNHEVITTAPPQFTRFQNATAKSISNHIKELFLKNPLHYLYYPYIILS